MPRIRTAPIRGKRVRPAPKRSKGVPRLRKTLIWAMVLSSVALGVWALVSGLGRGSVFARFAKITTVQAGFTEVVVSGEGIILRRESLYRSPAKGEITLLLAEGERVRVGSPVLEISNPSLVEDLETQAADTRAQMVDFEAREAQRLAALKEEILSNDAEILEALASLQEAVRQGDAAGIGKSWDALDGLLQLREEKGREVRDLENQWEGLVEHEGRLERQISESSSIMESQETGVLSYCIDGLEDKMAPERLSEVTAATIYQIKPEPEPATTGSVVEAGAPLFKVIDTSTILFAMAMPSTDALSVAERGTVTVRLSGSDGRTFRAQALGVGRKTGDDYGVVNLEALEFLEEMVTLRRVEAEIVVDVYEGTVVPARAVVERSGVTGVFVVEKATARFRPVGVLGQDGKDLVVEGLPPGSDVVVTPSLVRDGSSVR